MPFRLALAAFLGLSACSDDDPAAGPDPGGQTDLVSLRQSAALDGAFAGRIRITGDGWRATGPGQEIALTFEVDDLDQARQFELVVEADPPASFALDEAVFRPQQPFVTPFASGVELQGTRMRMGGASLTVPVSGSSALGTLTLHTSSTFGGLTPARLVVTLLSIGPSSSARDRYDAAALQLGVEVN